MDTDYFETDHTMTKTGLHNIINGGKPYSDINTGCNHAYVSYQLWYVYANRVHVKFPYRVFTVF